MSLPLDIRDPRLPGGRLALSATGTTDPVVLTAYRDAVLSVLRRPDAGEIVARLKRTKRQPGKITLAELRAAVDASDVTALLADKGSAPAEAEFPRAMLGRMVDRFMERVRADQRSGTADAYQMVCGFVEQAFGVVRGPFGQIVKDVPLASITPDQGQTWLKAPKPSAGNRPWAPRTQRKAHAVVAQVWHLGLADEALRAEALGIAPPLLRNFWRSDAVAPVRAARIRKRPPEFLTRSEVARVLWANRGRREAAWIALGVYAGLRQTEMRLLRTGVDVDMKRGVVRVQARGGAFAWEGPKSDRGNRVVEINHRLMRWLRAHVRAGYARTYFFATSRERPLSEDYALQWTKTAFQAGGVKYGRNEEGRTTHTLRHTCATWMASEGVSPATIAEILGDNIKVVMDTYLHAFPHDRKKALAQLAAPANRRRK